MHAAVALHIAESVCVKSFQILDDGCSFSLVLEPERHVVVGNDAVRILKPLVQRRRIPDHV